MPKKLKGGALQFVLFIGSVIALLLVTFVLLSYVHLHFTKKADSFVHVVKHNESALTMALYTNANGAGLLDTLSKVTTAEIRRDQWGVFEKLMVTTVSKKQKFVTTALVGQGLPGETALYLKDNEQPLVVVGKSRITGDAFLPQQGVRPGTISGKAYSGNRLLYGNRRQSTSELPLLPTNVLKSVDMFCNVALPFTVKSARTIDRNVYRNSFFEETLYLVGDVVDLSGMELTGNIIVVASDRILVNATTRLTDIILVAPRIGISDNFKGSLQAFGTREIRVGQNCQLDYPSVLVLKNKASTVPEQGTYGKDYAIFVDRGSHVGGSIIYLDSREEKYYFPQVKIKAGARVLGQVYCDKVIELNGAIAGVLYTDGFATINNGNVYQNHLFNGEIDFFELQEAYKGIPIGVESENKGVVKWLY